MPRQTWISAAFLLVGMPACEANVELDSPYGAGGAGGAATTTIATVATSSSGNECIPIDDGRPCVLDTCEDGIPGHVDAPKGTPCGAGLSCDGQGSCVGCFTASDCPGEDSECEGRSCKSGKCDLYFMGAGTALASQTPQDCVKVVCDGSGGTKIVADDADLPKDDGDLCSDDVCVMGVPSHPTKADGASCNDHDGCTQTDTCAAGTCVGDNPQLCPAGASCVGGACPCTGTVGLPGVPMLRVDPFPWDVASADLDGDGTMDLAVANDTVGVFLNQGGAEFSPQVDYDIGAIVTTIVAADITGDGKPDLLAASPSTNLLGVLINNGDGTFNPTAAFPLDVNRSSLEARDLNGDGKADVIATGPMTGIVSVMLSYGDGSFAPRIEYPGLSAQAATAADMNLDGSPDLVMVGVDSAGIAMNNGDGTFAPIVVSALPGDWVGIAADDLNADGTSDIVALNHANGTVSAFLNQGTGALGSGVPYQVGGATTNLVVADVTGDGASDIVLGTLATYESITVRAGDGLGGFGPKVDSANAVGVTRLLASDLNGDGVLDLALTRRFGQGLNLILSQGNGTFPELPLYSTAANLGSLKALDLSGDDVPDLLWTNYDSDTVSVRLNQGDGALGLEWTYPGVSAVVTATDVDGDALRDLVSVGYYESKLRVRLNYGTGTFAPGADYPTGLGPIAVAYLDANGDGHVDLATANWGADSVSVLLNKGDGTFADKVDYATASLYDVKPADLNGDGHLDLAVGYTVGSSVGVLLNDGTGVFGIPVDLDVGGATQAIALADFNGDGAIDVAAVKAWQTVGILMNQGAFTFVPVVDYPSGADGSGVEVTDLNNDGFPDLVVPAWPLAGTRVLFNQSDGTFADWVVYPMGGNYTPAAADLNGDGRPDLVIPNSYDDTLAVLFNACLP